MRETWAGVIPVSAPEGMSLISCNCTLHIRHEVVEEVSGAGIQQSE